MFDLTADSFRREELEMVSISLKIFFVIFLLLLLCLQQTTDMLYAWVRFAGAPVHQVEQLTRVIA